MNNVVYRKNKLYVSRQTISSWENDKSYPDIHSLLMISNLFGVSLRNYMNLESEMPENVTWREAEMKPFGSGAMMRGLPGDYYSTSRFVRAAYLNTHYPTKSTEEENVSRLFHTLSGVAMIEGAARMPDGEYEKTIYTGGFSSATQTYYYNTYEDPEIKGVSLRASFL